ncbi:MAG: sulfate adenylyltransferase, partial [bacterium]
MVDDRYEDYTAFPTSILVADDFFNSGVVLSKEKTSWKSLDLLKLEGVMRIDDVEVGRGSGADILGHPMEALAWLANHCI